MYTVANKMSSSAGFLESLQNDLRSLSTEGRKKFPQVIEVCIVCREEEVPWFTFICLKASERAILSLRKAEEQKDIKEWNAAVQGFTSYCDLRTNLQILHNPPFPSPAVARSEDALRPFLLACELKNSKVASLAIVAIHKLIIQNCVDVVRRDNYFLTLLCTDIFILPLLHFTDFCSQNRKQAQFASWLGRWEHTTQNSASNDRPRHNFAHTQQRLETGTVIWSNFFVQASFAFPLS